MRKPLKYLFILTCLLSHVSFLGQNTEALKIALKNATHDTTRCRVLLAMVEIEEREPIWTGYNEEVKKIAVKNIASGGTLKKVYSNFLASAYNNTGVGATYNGDNVKALENFQKSLLLFKETGNKNGAAQPLNNIGYVYDVQGNIVLALEYFHETLKINEELKNDLGIANVLNNIGTIYSRQGETKKALEYLYRGLKKREALNDKPGVAQSLNNIGAIYDVIDDTKANEYYQKSFAIYQEIGDKLGIANSSNNIGSIYHRQGNHSLALTYFEKSLKIHEEINNKSGIAFSLNNIATLLWKTKRYDEALVYALKGMQAAKEAGYPERIQSSADILKRIFLQQKKYKDAFNMFELENKMRDSLINQETQKAALKKQMQYDYEKKEIELKAEQDKKDAISKEELKQKEKERNYFIGGFALVILLALFILRSYRQKQKDNKIITEQKNLVDAKQKEILDSIHYAKRIQTALLPSEKYIDKSIKQLTNKTLLPFIFCLLSLFSLSQKTDSLKLALKNVKHDTSRVKILTTLSEYFSPGEDQWQIYNEEIIKISEKYAGRLATRTDTFFMRNLASSTSNKGYALNMRGNTLEGLAYFERGLQLSENTGDKLSIANTLINIGSVYDNQGNLSKSLDYYHRGLAVLEKLNDKESMSVTFINIGNIYKKLKDLATAMSYYNKSLKLNTEINNQNGIGMSLNYIGMVYDEQGKEEKALDHYKKSLVIGEKLRNKNVCAKALNNIGSIYFQINDYKKAKEHYLKSIKYYEEIRDIKGTSNTYDNLAKVFIAEGNLSDAYQYAKPGFDMAEKSGNIRAIMNSSRTLKVIFQKQNNYKEAYEMYALEVKMGDSINNQETRKAAIKKQLEYTYEKKGIELKAEQDKKDALANEELKQKEKERNYFIIGFALVLLLVAFILRNFRQKQKATAIILAQKQLADAKQKEIVDSIYYAKRIQQALLPSEKYIKKSLESLRK
ncbi:MAG: tetratricopeptide repeat protein [Bacteroidetes bacterium]|nr:tetratricopeptide repeat protein [Bacteroidota bacterium]